MGFFARLFETKEQAKERIAAYTPEPPDLPAEDELDWFESARAAAEFNAFKEEGVVMDEARWNESVDLSEKWTKWDADRFNEVMGMQWFEHTVGPTIESRLKLSRTREAFDVWCEHEFEKFKVIPKGRTPSMKTFD